MDAICINQESNEERSDQVRLMMRIYRTTRRVAIWLGPEVDDSKLAMDLICELFHNPGYLNYILEDPNLRPDVKALALLSVEITGIVFGYFRKFSMPGR